MDDWTAVAEAFQTLTALIDAQLTLSFPFGSLGGEPDPVATATLRSMIQSAHVGFSWSPLPTPSPLQLRVLQQLPTHFVYLSSFFRYFGLLTALCDASSSESRAVSVTFSTLLSSTPSPEEAFARIVALKYYLMGCGLASILPTVQPQLGSHVGSSWSSLAEMCLQIAPLSPDARSAVANLTSTVLDQLTIIGACIPCVLLSPFNQAHCSFMHPRQVARFCYAAVLGRVFRQFECW